MKSKVSTVNPFFVAGYTFRGSNSPTFIFASCFISRNHKTCIPLKKKMVQKYGSGFSLTPYLESFTPTFGLGTPVFPRIFSNLHCGTPTFSKRCLWDSYFQNPSENPVASIHVSDLAQTLENIFDLVAK